MVVTSIEVTAEGWGGWRRPVVVAQVFDAFKEATCRAPAKNA